VWGGQQYCPNFAYWGSTPPEYVELTGADGTPSDYLWVDTKGEITFETSPLNIPPPPGLPLLGELVENGTFQEVDQVFPAGSNRPLYVAGGGQMMLASPAPEPTTLWMFGAGGFALLGRRRLR
jgi:PEP-CTERM motif